jgi:hypothetical protein
MGSFLSPDPTRIIAKRIILTGHPFKVHKKTATIRYMFFNREDIEYFKSVELHTKFGRIGHITEPLGTKGYFKVHFDGPFQQIDTVCMSLYKRQYPKVCFCLVEGGGAGADGISGVRSLGLKPVLMILTRTMRWIWSRCLLNDLDMTMYSVRFESFSVPCTGSFSTSALLSLVACRTTSSP